MNCKNCEIQTLKIAEFNAFGKQSETGGGGRLHVSGEVRKRFLSIFRERIFDSSVDLGMPNLAAAPVGPNIRPRLSFRAASIMSFSCTKSRRGSSTCGSGSGFSSGWRGNQLSSIEKISDSQRITERSMTF